MNRQVTKKEILDTLPYIRSNLRLTRMVLEGLRNSIAEFLPEWAVKNLEALEETAKHVGIYETELKIAEDLLKEFVVQEKKDATKSSDGD